MTEIDVVKKSSHLWLWIVVALLVVAALFFMMRGRSEPRNGRLIQDDGHPHTVVALIMRG